MALKNMGGQAGELYDDWRLQLTHCMAHIESYIDFGEDEGIESDVFDAATASVCVCPVCCYCQRMSLPHLLLLPVYVSAPSAATASVCLCIICCYS